MMLWKRGKRAIVFAVVLVAMGGCAATAHKKDSSAAQPPETQKEIQTAVGTIVNTVSGKQVSVRYCPVCGKHYSAKLGVCPKDDSPLRDVAQ